MYLRTLIVEAGGHEIRRVQFRRGLNLIADETPSKHRRASGNNVGKTTALRCIDFCLEGDPKSLYLDREWQASNETVLSFLESRKPVFVLELEDIYGSTFEIRRQFGQAVRVFNGTELTASRITTELRSLLFRVEGKKPSLRQLLGKFVRLSPTAKSHTLHWLHTNTSDAEYDIVWLTLFGFPLSSVLNERRSLQSELKLLDNRRKEITAVATSPRQVRKIIERDLAEATKQLGDFAVAAAQERDLERLGALRERIATISLELAEADSHVSNATRTLDLLKKSVPRVAPATIREVFEDTDRFVGQLHASYEQLVEFHNTMLKNKAAFTRRATAGWREKSSQLKAQLREAGEEEATLLRTFASPDIWEDVRRLNDEVARLTKQQGYLEGLERELKTLADQISTTRAAIADAESTIDSQRDTLESHLEGFNEYFSTYSRSLYGSGYYLDLRLESTSKGRHKVVPSIPNIEGHEGSGRKRTEIAAFDLAYLRWQQERKARTIRFTIHDEVEQIYGNQLATLFEIAEGLDAQFVVPVLSDKLRTVPFEKTEACTVLKLSEDDRFFRIT